MRTIKAITTAALLFSFLFTQAQEESNRTYHLNLKVDIPLTAVALGATYFGFERINGKDTVTNAELYALSKNDVPGIDRSAAGNWSNSAEKLSDPFFFGAFPFGLVLLADRAARSEVGTIGLMYLQAVAISSGIYASVTGASKRFRPLTYQDYDPANGRTVEYYNEKYPELDLNSRGNRNSFFGGHPMITATTTFFVAKVYHDLHPDSNFKYALWGFAGASTAFCAAMRYKAGKHFPTDLITGVSIGVLSGILVPEFHKKKPGEGGFSMTPLLGTYKGLAMNYPF